MKQALKHADLKCDRGLAQTVVVILLQHSVQRSHTKEVSEYSQTENKGFEL
jgi:hypothetical protein